ncbi:MAG: hypothetical protein AAF587_15085 [Bacteroidota bacterium]
MKQPKILFAGGLCASVWACMLLFTAGGCRLNPTEGLSWDTDLLAPIAFTRVDVFDAIQDTTLLTADSDQLLHLVFRDTVGSAKLVDFVEIPDTTLDVSISLDTLELSSDTIFQRLTLLEVAEQLQADGNNIGTFLINNDGNTMPFVPAIEALGSGPIDVDATEFFEFAELESGQLVLTIENSFPVALEEVIFFVQNKNLPGPPLVADTFPFIDTSEIVIRTYDLAGKQVESQLEAELVNMNTVAALNVPIDLEDFIEIRLVAENMRAKTATAIFPQQTILDTTRTTQYLFGGEFDDVQLTKLGVKSGKIRAETTSTVEDTILFSYFLPSAQNANNDIPGVNIKLNPAPAGGVAHQTEEALLNGFTIDLTAGGDHVNAVEEQIKVDLLYSGNVVTLDQQDSVSVSFGLVDIEPTYMEGYIGKNEFVLRGEEALDFFEQIDVEKIRFAGASAEILFSNSVGVDAQMEVRAFDARNSNTGNTLKLTGTPLVAGPFLIEGPNLPDTSGVVMTSLSFTPDNSNIVPFINLLADNIRYDMTVLTNHNGNPDLKDNFATANSQISAVLDFSLPLEGVIGGLRLGDTTALNFDSQPDLNTINNGTLRLLLENRFPLQVTVDAHVYDANWDLVSTLAEAAVIEAGERNAIGYVEEGLLSMVEKDLTIEELEEVIELGKHLVLSFQVDTQPDNEDVKIYADYDIIARLVGEFTLRLEN